VTTGFGGAPKYLRQIFATTEAEAIKEAAKEFNVAMHCKLLNGDILAYS